MCVQLVKNNTMLAGTQHNGLFYFDNATLNGKQVPIEVNNKISSDYYITGIKYDVANDVTYVFVQGKGLFSYNTQKHTLNLKNNVYTQANCISVSRDGKLWVGNNAGLYQLDNKTNTYSNNVIPFKGPVVNLCEDKKGTLWIATDGGGVWLLPAGQNKAEPLSAISTENNLPIINSNAIYAIYEDKQERKWIGTLRGGINVIEPQQSKFKRIIYQSLRTTLVR